MLGLIYSVCSRFRSLCWLLQDVRRVIKVHGQLREGFDPKQAIEKVLPEVDDLWGEVASDFADVAGFSTETRAHFFRLMEEERIRMHLDYVSRCADRIAALK